MRKGKNYMPEYIVESIQDITPGFLKNLGAKGILIDVDNTLAYDNRKDIFPGVPRWVELMKAAGVKIIIMSNSFKVRVSPVAKALDLPYMTRCHKPAVKSYLKAAQLLGLSPDECIMVGDQMLTDIRGANESGIKSVYVMPVAFETNIFYKNIFKTRRANERKVIMQYNEAHGTEFDLPPQIKAEMRKEDLI